jgi:ribosomal protein L22
MAEERKKKDEKKEGAKRSPRTTARGAAKGKERASAESKDRERTRSSAEKPSGAGATAERRQTGERRQTAESGQTGKQRQTGEQRSRRAEERSAEPARSEKSEKAPARRSASRRDGAPVQRPVVRAQAKYIRSSARKARLVIDHIRGKPIDEARAVLRHSPRGVARDLEKLLASAVANAENNHDLVGDELLVKEAYADEGPTLKRFRPRALGRATRIRKRTSHLTVTLTTKE